MNDQEFKMETLIQRHLNKFTVDDPACHVCGENNPLCLRPQNLGAEQEIYCWNCWKKEQEAKLDSVIWKKRRAAKLKELSPHLPICLTCGETEPCVLQLHHWLQEHYSDQTQVNCENCHRLFNATQYAYHPPVPREEPSLIAYAAKILFALADEYELRAMRHQKIISELAQLFLNSPITSQKGA